MKTIPNCPTSQNLGDAWHGYLAILFFKYGAVSGAVRRIVSLWPGEFTVRKIEDALHVLYPGLMPSEYQVLDCIQGMVSGGRVKVVTTGNNGKVYLFTERARESVWTTIRRHLEALRA